MDHFSAALCKLRVHTAGGVWLFYKVLATVLNYTFSATHTLRLYAD